MPDEIEVKPTKKTSVSTTRLEWFVTIPGCELGRLRVKGRDEDEATANYRSLTKMIGGKPVVEPAS